jgi:hypothetical protein
MAEAINKRLLACSLTPNVGYFTVKKSSILGDVTEELKSLSSKDLSRVYNFAKYLNLPQSFKRELEFNYEIRGFKVS